MNRPSTGRHRENREQEESDLQPTVTVISELLRFQQRKRQVGEQADGYEQTDGVIEQHLLTSLESIAAGDVAEAEDEKCDGHENEHEIEHRSFPPGQVMRALGIRTSCPALEPCAKIRRSTLRPPRPPSRNPEEFLAISACSACSALKRCDFWNHKEHEGHKDHKEDFFCRELVCFLCGLGVLCVCPRSGAFVHRL